VSDELSEPRFIHVLLIEEFADWEPALALCELARRGGQWRPITIGLERGRVRSMGGLSVEVERRIDEIDPQQITALMAIGSSAWERGEVPPVSSLLRAAWHGGAIIGAICGATLAAGHAGLLTGRHYTSNAPDFVRSKIPPARLGTYVDAPAVRDGLLITASGLGYIEFAAEMLAAIGAMRDDERAGWVSFLRGTANAA
jgi:putative intracellular protease/amidase